MSKLLTFALVAAGLASCQSPISFNDRKLLAVAEQKWARRGFTDYAFEMRRSCFCPPELGDWARVEVVGGAVQRVVILSSGTVITDFRREYWFTVEGLFEAIHRAAGQDWIERVQFEFDETLGFPTLIRWISAPDVLDAGGIDHLRNVVPLP